MLGADVPHDVVPYFFSDLSDWTSLEYVGPALAWDEEVVRGTVDDGAFAVWYLEAGRVRGMLSVNGGGDVDAARELVATGRAVGAAGVPLPGRGDQ
jgi:3-phenylpropionate/trans-cinnamate dioxygenase ferredoxin reductase subunit